jgi:hypothetical protein
MKVIKLASLIGILFCCTLSHGMDLSKNLIATKTAFDQFVQERVLPFVEEQIVPAIEKTPSIIIASGLSLATGILGSLSQVLRENPSKLGYLMVMTPSFCYTTFHFGHLHRLCHLTPEDEPGKKEQIEEHQTGFATWTGINLLAISITVGLELYNQAS